MDPQLPFAVKKAVQIRLKAKEIPPQITRRRRKRAGAAADVAGWAVLLKFSNRSQLYN